MLLLTITLRRLSASLLFLLLSSLAAAALPLPVSPTDVAAASSADVIAKAQTLMDAGSHADAIVLLQPLAEQMESMGEEAGRHAERVRCMLMLAECYDATDQPDAAYPIAKRLMQLPLTEEEKAETTEMLILCAYDWATLLINTRECPQQLQQAQSLLYEVLPLASGDDLHALRKCLAFAWYVEGHLHLVVQEEGAGRRCMTEAYPLFCQIGHSTGAYLSAKAAGDASRELCELQPALEAYEKAWAAAKSANNGGKMMELLKEKKKLYRILGDSHDEAKISMQMDSLVRCMNSDEATFFFHEDKGHEALEQGNYDLAELWFKKNADIVQRNAPEQMPYASLYLSDLRELYIAAQRYEEALLYAQRCTRFYEKHFGPEHTATRLTHSTTANIYQRMGDRERCMAHIDSLFLGLDATATPRELFPHYVMRGLAHSAFQEYEAAYADYCTIDSLLATEVDATDPSRIQLQALTGGVCIKLKRYEEAEQRYKRHARLTAETYGEYCQNHIEAINYMANAEGFAGNLDAACRHLTLATEKMVEHIKKQHPHKGIKDRDAAWERISKLMTDMTPFAIKAGKVQTDFTRLCYDALLLSKAFLLEKERTAFEIISRQGDEAAINEYLEIASLQLKMEKLEKDYRLNADSITALAAHIATHSQHLAARCQAFGDITAFMETDYEDVKLALGRKEVLIDFTDYSTESEGRKYAAYIVRQQQENPLLLPLFDERAISSLGVTAPQEYYEGAAAEMLRSQLWKPLSKQVKRGSTIYYVPSQFLFQIALENIPLKDGSILGDHYHFVRLSSARELLRHSSSIAQKGVAPRAVLYGGLQYDLSPEEMLADHERHRPNIPPVFAARGENGLRGSRGFAELPGTRQEVLEVEQVLQRQEVSVERFMGPLGTSESFVSMSGNAPDLLLVATHGFYYTPQEAANYDYLKGYKDAMSLSGIVLAGGNNTWQGKTLPDGVMGGILTANDIAKMNLDGLQLVMLSACRTGAGQSTREGIYGLQRGFKKAGAKTIVMTLWNVSDVVTREFIVKFCQSLADSRNAWDKHAAFSEAKSYIRQRYPDPYCWAPFIMLD